MTEFPSRNGGFLDFGCLDFLVLYKVSHSSTWGLEYNCLLIQMEGSFPLDNDSIELNVRSVDSFEELCEDIDDLLSSLRCTLDEISQQTKILPTLTLFKQVTLTTSMHSTRLHISYLILVSCVCLFSVCAFFHRQRCSLSKLKLVWTMPSNISPLTRPNSRPALGI